MKHWSPLLATSRCQQLLFRIVDGLLLPHNLPQDKALRDSLPLYLQVRTVWFGLLVTAFKKPPNVKHRPAVLHELTHFCLEGSVGGLRCVSVSGGLPEAAAALCNLQISGPLPACLAVRWQHRQPPRASGCV